MPPPNKYYTGEAKTPNTSPTGFRISIPQSPNILEVEDNKDEEKDDNDISSNEKSSEKSSDNKKTVQFDEKSNETKKITI